MSVSAGQGPCWRPWGVPGDLQVQETDTQPSRSGPREGSSCHPSPEGLGRDVFPEEKVAVSGLKTEQEGGLLWPQQESEDEREWEQAWAGRMDKTSRL